MLSAVHAPARRVCAVTSDRQSWAIVSLVFVPWRPAHKKDIVLHLKQSGAYLMVTPHLHCVYGVRLGVCVDRESELCLRLCEEAVCALCVPLLLYAAPSGSGAIDRV